MNDTETDTGSGGGSAFGAFKSDALATAKMIMKIARDKVRQEGHHLVAQGATLPGTITWMVDDKNLGDLESCESFPVVDKVEKFVDHHCFDYSSIQIAYERAFDAEDLLDEEYGTISMNIGEGLGTWDEESNDAAKAFKENYVVPMDKHYKNQGKSIDHYRTVLLLAGGAAEANRKLLKKHLKKVKKAILEYDPYWGVTIPWIGHSLDLALLLAPELAPATAGLKFVAKKGIEGVASKLVEGGKKALEYNESAVNIVQSLKDGIDELSKSSEDSFDGVAAFVDQFIEGDTAKANVMPCPRY